MKTLADQAQARRDKNKMARERKMAVAAKKSEGAQPIGGRARRAGAGAGGRPGAGAACAQNEK